MQTWWTGLSGTTQWFFLAAVFFSIFFLWQLIAAFLGMDGDDMDLDADVSADGSEFDAPDDLDDPDAHDTAESAQAFRVLSLRSLITFCTLFTWGSALYTADGMSTVKALTLSSVWGVIGMFAIAFVIFGMNKLAETGTKDAASCKGKTGTVYLDIPEDGFGEIRIMITGAVQHIKAQSLHGEALPAGTRVRVVEVVGQSLVKVEAQTEQGEPS